MHDRGKRMRRGDHQISGFEATFQQQDGLTAMRVAQAYGVVEIEQREAVRLLERAGRAQ